MFFDFTLIWLEIIVRWLHVIAGIAWIGSSFYFIALDHSLNTSDKLPEKAHGQAWQVHGGGFYHLVKYLVAPKDLPDELTWFKWEAYTTWISGFFLLILVYFANTELYMIDSFKLDINQFEAISISILGIVLGWIIYDLICRSPIGQNTTLLVLSVFAFILLTSYFYGLIFSGRGAFTQIGVMIGTIMVANVAMVIIPGQRKVVASLISGKKPDSIHGIRAKQRSLHNNYLTLPVIFIMLGGHYPILFSTKYSWLLIALVIVIGGLIRHFFNSQHAKKGSPWWTWILSFMIVLIMIYITNLGKPSKTDDLKLTELSKSLNQEILASAMETTLTHCSMCHASSPQWHGMKIPPKGIVLETSEDILENIDMIMQQAVWSNAMPPGNITWMEYGERESIENLYLEVKKIKIEIAS